MEVNEDAADFDADWGEYFDEKVWKASDSKLVRAAREAEVSFMEQIHLFHEVEESEAWQVTGKAPTTTKRVDINKGTEEKPDIRCRLVARDFKPKGEKSTWNIFAAMPPLEAKTLLMRYMRPCRKLLPENRA